MQITKRKVEPVATKNGGVHYRVRIFRSGKSTVRTFSTYTKAQQFNEQVDRIGVDNAIANLHMERAQTERNRNKRKTTLREYMLQHVDGLINVNEQYKDFIASVANSLGTIGDLRLRDIEKEDMERIVTELIKSGNAPKTIRNKFRAIAGVMKKAHQSGIILSNPAYGVRLPRLEHHQMQTLEPDEIRTLLEIMHPHYRDFTQTLFRTGLRFGEITALEVGHFDKVHRTLHIEQAWGDRGRKLQTPKTERSNRIINVPPDIYDILTAHCKGKTKLTRIFSTINGHRIKSDAYHKVWQKALRILNGDRTHRPAHITPQRFKELPIIDKHIRIHDARHTYASMLINNGTPIATVSDLLGHADIQITAKRYSHLQDAGRKAALKALGDAP
ncbi:MAG: site-specific integrase [Bifidobacteriaceae bacterium]|jgi:integrase|nr:site-specific integrase [Bifidobacteriaceae bacterium]